ncbi:MAG: hypothetical protein K2M95_01720 [Clostridiales bacterium]|nr:hypothetical protein [Clostridiales bacterium]
MRSRKGRALCAKIAYGAGGLACAAGVTLLPLLLPLSTAAGVHKIALMLSCGLGLGLSVFLMPLFYALINGNTLIATGRYHIPFVVSVLLVSLCAVGITCIGRLHAVLQALILFGLFFLLALGIQIFAFTYFSIGKRFAYVGDVFAFSKVFAYITPVLGALAVLWLFDADRDGLCGIMCLASLCTLAGLVFAYMATSSRMALFLRVESFHRRTLAENYKRFIEPLTEKRALLRFVASALSAAGIAVAVCAFPQTVFAARLGYAQGFKPTVLILAGFCALMGIVTSLSGKARERAEHTSLVLCIVTVVATCGMVVLRFFAGAKALDTATAYVYALLLGLAVGAALPCMGKQSGLAADETGTSTGRTFALYNCAVTIGIAVGTALSALAAFFRAKSGVAAAVVSFVLFALFFLAGTLLRFFVHKRATAETSEEKENG